MTLTLIFGLNSIEYDLKKSEILYFLHIPKTGGISLESILDNQYSLESIKPNRNDPHYSPEKEGVFEKYSLIRGHFGYGLTKSLGSQIVVITILRDPINLVLSRYEHEVRRIILQDPDKKIPSLGEMLEDQKTQLKFWNIQTRYLSSDLDIVGIQKSNSDENKKKKSGMGMVERTRPFLEDKKLLEIAKKRLESFAFIGITEKYQDSVNLLYYTFGWKPFPKVPKLNTASKKTKKDDLPKEVINKIHEITKLDQEVYRHGEKIFEENYRSMISNLEKKFKDNVKSTLTDIEIAKYLEKKFLERINSKNNIKLQSSINYSFDQSLIGFGWHSREKWTKAGPIFRWTGPNLETAIEFPLEKNKDFMIKIYILSTDRMEIIQELKCEVDGIAIDLKNREPKIRLRGNKELILEGYIPKKIVKKEKLYNRISLKIKKTVSPRTINEKSRDTRNLGVAISKIQID